MPVCELNSNFLWEKHQGHLNRSDKNVVIIHITPLLFLPLICHVLLVTGTWQKKCEVIVKVKPFSILVERFTWLIGFLIQVFLDIVMKDTSIFFWVFRIQKPLKTLGLLSYGINGHIPLLRSMHFFNLTIILIRFSPFSSVLKLL